VRNTGRRGGSVKLKSFTLFSFSFIRVCGFREKDLDVEREKKNYKKKCVTYRGYV